MAPAELLAHSSIASPGATRQIALMRILPLLALLLVAAPSLADAETPLLCFTPSGACTDLVVAERSPERIGRSSSRPTASPQSRSSRHSRPLMLAG